ncbi:MAG: RNA polymerase sigma factor [Bradymonadia bacterium]
MLFASLLRQRSAALDIDQLYRRHAGLVVRRARRFFPDEAEEVAHEVFLRVIEKAHTFRGEASPTTWLYQLTTRHCLNRLRSSRRRSAALALYREDPWGAPVGKDPEVQLFLEQAWATLDPELATLGVYYFVDDLTHQQIADMTGVSRRTVGNRIDDLRAHIQRIAGGKHV